jgi:hypothetical protein
MFVYVHKKMYEFNISLETADGTTEKVIRTFEPIYLVSAMYFTFLCQ